MDYLPELNIRDLLDAKLLEFCRPEFVDTDPIQVPHRFSRKEDVEISAFLTASLAWGGRPMIIRNCLALLQRMDNAPYDFVCGAATHELVPLVGFYYRTFNDTDLLHFVRALRHIYQYYGGLEGVFTEGYRRDETVKSALVHFRERFFETEHLPRTQKHVADVQRGSAAKRINMLLRWMVRCDAHGIDFGLWKGIPASALMMPLDLHSAAVARRLGLLQRKQTDWRAVEELTAELRLFDPTDPVKYDFALFGLGVFDKFWM